VDGVRSGRAVDVRFTALSRGQTIFDGTATVQLHAGYVNGQGCPPTTWFAQVSPHGSGPLEQDDVTYSDVFS
jgi:hypothetical protein